MTTDSLTYLSDDELLALCPPVTADSDLEQLADWAAQHNAARLERYPEPFFLHALVGEEWELFSDQMAGSKLAVLGTRWYAAACQADRVVIASWTTARPVEKYRTVTWDEALDDDGVALYAAAITRDAMVGRRALLTRSAAGLDLAVWEATDPHDMPLCSQIRYELCSIDGAVVEEAPQMFASR